MKTKINVQNNTKYKHKIKNFKKILQNILSMDNVIKNSCIYNIELKELSINFVFCDDKFIHEINKQYRKKDAPTDVISFALFSDDENSINLQEIDLGEIIISIDTAQKQADNNKHSLDKEIYFLAAHGILHLLGFDHLTEQEYNFMVDTQNEAIKEL